GLLALDRSCCGDERLDDLVCGSVDSDAECHRVCARGNVLESAAHDRLSENRSGGGAVAGNIVGLGGDTLDELCAEVLEGIFEIDLTGDAHTVVSDGGAAECLGEHDVASTRAQGHLDGVGELV